MPVECTRFFGGLPHEKLVVLPEILLPKFERELHTLAKLQMGDPFLDMTYRQLRLHLYELRVA